MILIVSGDSPLLLQIDSNDSTRNTMTSTQSLRRPAFKRLELDRKVRFLSYETIDEIDDCFSGSNSGLSVDLIVGKSELVI